MMPRHPEEGRAEGDMDSLHGLRIRDQRHGRLPRRAPFAAQEGAG